MRQHLSFNGTTSALLILLVTFSSTAAGAERASRCSDLWDAHTFAIDVADQGENVAAALRNALQRSLPEFREMEPQAADIVIEYRAYVAAGNAVAAMPLALDREPPDLEWLVDEDGKWLQDFHTEWVRTEMTSGHAPSNLVAEREDNAAPLPFASGPDEPPQVRWSATLSRWDCQNTDLGERPTRALDGFCEGRVHVRVHLGTLESGKAESTDASEAFAIALRDTILHASSTLPCTSE